MRPGPSPGPSARRATRPSPEVQARVQAIQSTLRKLKEEASVRAKLREWDLILAQVETLRQYEARAILTTCPPPSTLLQEFQIQREALARTG